jgi:uncharacterized protein YidB (DUF937 family)
MGLFDQILGGLAGGAMGRSGLGRMGGAGLSPVVAALLPVVLRALSQRGASAGGASAGGRGGLGGLLGGGLLGGGLGGLLSQLAQSGYGQQTQSWVSTGPNEPLPPQALDEVLGPDQVAQIAAEAGVSPHEARDGLAQLLPEVVNHLTPDGELPADQQLQNSVQDFASRLGI